MEEAERYYHNFALSLTNPPFYIFIVNNEGIMEALPKGERAFTYADYKVWELKEGERYELIYGVAYAMAAPNARHQEILSFLLFKFYGFLQGKPYKVYPAPYDVRLFYKEDESDDTVVQPDISVVCDAAKCGKEGCHGAPDLVIEILSPSDTVIEIKQKFELYRNARVREYWFVDPESKKIHAHRFSKDKISSDIYNDTGIMPVGIFPELTIPLEQVFAE
jgi:Uma2 family endonuclease